MSSGLDGFIGLNAADDLEGQSLPGGWQVVRKRLLEPGDTGGHFSINYWVENDDGRKGFCKVLNYAWLKRVGLFGGDPLEELAHATALYQFERDLARACVDLSRVVTAIDDGSITVDGYVEPLVSYIIFEQADRDIRRLLDAADRLDVAVRLRALHHLATGLQQLHGRGVAHQDVKPSNTLVFAPDEVGRRTTKVGDLGRASVTGRPMQHDELEVVGDRTYGPPEGLYRAVPEGFGPRRLACDLYQLGSMICFVFTSSPINAILTTELHPAHGWGAWGGTYEEVLPYVRDAFGRALEHVRAAVPEPLTDDVVALIGYLCEPDPKRRGHPRTRQLPGNPYALERIVSELDRLCRRAEVALRVVA